MSNGATFVANDTISVKPIERLQYLPSIAASMIDVISCWFL